MRFISRIFSTSFVIFTLVAPAFSQTTFAGGRGMFRIFSAQTIQAGSIFLNASYLSFFRSSGKDQTLNLGLTYGVTNNVELTALVVPYQDDQKHNWGPPGDTQVGIKWRLPLASSRFSAGLRGLVILPTALQHNAPLEPYSSDQVAWGIMGLLSFDLTNSFGKLPLKIHANFGYLDHNIETLLSKGDTDQVLLGVGFKFSAYPFIIYTEYTGEFFLNNNAIKFGDNSMRLTQGFKFLGPLNLIVDFGLDIGLSRELESYPGPVHKYADWKIITGLTYHFKMDKVHGYAAKETEIDRKKENKALEALKKKRKNVDQNLNEKRKSLEKGTKKNK